MSNHVIWAPELLRNLRLTSCVIAAAVASFMLLVSVTPANAGTIRRAKNLNHLANHGMSLASKNGQLVFSNFKVEITGGSLKLSDYRVKARSDGFKLVGKGMGSSSEFLDIVLTYDVSTTSAFLVLDGVGMSSKKWNKFGTNELGIEDFNEGGNMILDESRDGGGKKMKKTFWSFSEADDKITVVETIRIGKAGKWNLRRRFTTSSATPFSVATVPEPNTALLLGFGLVGLARFGRRS